MQTEVKSVPETVKLLSGSLTYFLNTWPLAAIPGGRTV